MYAGASRAAVALRLARGEAGREFLAVAVAAGALRARQLLAVASDLTRCCSVDDRVVLRRARPGYARSSKIVHAQPFRTREMKTICQS
jgi:hypothetical protein